MKRYFRCISLLFIFVTLHASYNLLEERVTPSWKKEDGVPTYPHHSGDYVSSVP